MEQPNLETNNDTGITAGIKENKQHDEVKNYLNARYLSASEAIWRLFGFEMNAQNPHTHRLPIHLPDQQHFFFLGTETKENIENKNVETKLIAYFKLCSLDQLARSLRYFELPLHYIWNSGKKMWTKRIRYDLFSLKIVCLNII